MYLWTKNEKMESQIYNSHISSIFLSRLKTNYRIFKCHRFIFDDICDYQVVIISSSFLIFKNLKRTDLLMKSVIAKESLLSIFRQICWKEYERCSCISRKRQQSKFPRSLLSNEDVLDFAAIFVLYISLMNNLLYLFPRSYLIPCLSISFQSCALLLPDIFDSAIVTLQILSVLFFFFPF